MLALVGTRYHFRRVVPIALRALFGKTEFWISLKTGNKSDTSLLIMAFYNLVTRKDLLMLHADTIRKQEDVIDANEFKMAQELKLEISIVSIARYRDVPKSSWVFDRIKNPYRASTNDFALARLNKIRWTTMFVILGINKMVGRNIIDCDLPSIGSPLIISNI